MDDRKHEGDILLETLKQAYTFVKGDFTKHELLMREAIILSALPRLYGNDWEQEKPRVLEQNGWIQQSNELVIVSPTKTGKTRALVIHVACMIASIPECHISTFSIYPKEFAHLVMMRLNAHPFTKENKLRIVSKNEKHIVIEWPSKSRSTIDFFSSNEKSKLINISDADCIIVDNASSCCHRVLKDEIATVLNLQFNIVLIMADRLISKSLFGHRIAANRPTQIIQIDNSQLRYFRFRKINII